MKAPSIFVAYLGAAGLDPAYWHLLTNHIPILITLSGLIALGLAAFSNGGPAKHIALFLLLVGIVGGIVTYWLGQAAYKPVRGMADEVGQKFLDLHMERAENVIWVFWLGAAACGVALFAEIRKLRHARSLTMVAWLLAAAIMILSGWIADAGGKIRHPEIRGDEKLPSDAGQETTPHKH